MVRIRRSARSFFALLVFGTASILQAQNVGRAIQLEPWQPQTPVSEDVSHNYRGTCGGNEVHVLGVNPGHGMTFQADADYGADFFIVKESRERFSLRQYLSWNTGIACVGAAGTKRLLIWGDCGGSACANIPVTFSVLDMRTLRFVAGGDGQPDCSAQCAQRLTGSQIPLQVERFYRE